MQSRPAGAILIKANNLIFVNYPTTTATTTKDTNVLLS